MSGTDPRIQAMVPRFLLPVARRVRLRVQALQMAVSHRVRISRAFQSALARDHPYLYVLPSAYRYNKQRTSEAGIGILDTNRILNFHLVLDVAKHCSDGDYAELGTYRGMTAEVIWRRKVPGAKFFVFDTFTGFSRDDLEGSDGRIDRASEADRFRDTSIEVVSNRVAGGAHPDLVFRSGYFPSTFAGLENRRFRFVHVDMDLADPIRAALDLFWPRIVDGGAIMVHDYFSARYPMARETVDDFFRARGITPIGLNDRLGTALVIRQRGMT